MDSVIVAMIKVWGGGCPDEQQVHVAWGVNDPRLLRARNRHFLEPLGHEKKGHLF